MTQNSFATYGRQESCGEDYFRTLVPFFAKAAVRACPHEKARPKALSNEFTYMDDNRNAMTGRLRLVIEHLMFAPGNRPPWPRPRLSPK